MLRDLFALTRFGRRQQWRPNQRVISLDGLEPFLFETHGPADTYISRSIEQSGIWEKATTGLLLELLRHDVDFIDVGANIGWHSVVAGHRLGNRGQVHCFEPEQRNLEKLRTNVALSGLDNIVVNGWALSDCNRVDVLSLSPDNLGDHRLGNSRADLSDVQVEVRRLDDYGGIRDRPLVVKLDVQGSERHVVDGGRNVIGNHKHEIVLICELCPMMLRERGTVVDELFALLVANGFVAATVDQRTGSIQPMGWARLKERISAGERNDPEYSEDIIAFRRPDGVMRSLFKR